MRPDMLRAVCGMALLAVAVHAQQPDTVPRTAIDTLVLRARRIGESGNVADARRLLDSALRVAPSGSASYAEALYWRGALAPAAVDAERDYRRLLIEAPLSARAEDAMLQLAQLEQARGDRRGASDHFQRFMLSYPENPARPRVAVSLVRLLFEQGQTRRGCDALGMGREAVPAQNLELRNQLEFYAPRCVDFEATPSAPATATPSAPATAATTSDSATRRDTAAAPSPSPATQAPPTPRASEPRSAAAASPGSGSPFYSVQVAAYDSREPASRMMRALKSRGHDARVDGTARPFRVRVGKYGTRADAVKAAARLKSQGVGGFVALVKGER